ncbi:hypothetical protein FY034_02825 [Trichlorobacter lovleyi]|uniref:hypothetical protein n=1 Tax=Trichlorobacter lovleyi TaxID=313985 RepID=UPI00223F056E|nr:hypothetical protein [Trichlorobacter lovleyi]QOX77919.1 hypothetical protein FY034_02825 [Trichlorobacter lovleyi]
MKYSIVSINVVKKLFKFIGYAFLFFIICALAPLYVKEISPYYWGKLECLTGFDMTGFLFTPWHGHGNCRIVNSQKAFEQPGSKIVLGMVKPLDNKQYPHLWSYFNNKIIDLACPEQQENCKNRRIFAIIDPVKIDVTYKNTINELDEYHIRWGLKYLSGFKSSI